MNQKPINPEEIREAFYHYAKEKLNIKIKGSKDIANLQLMYDGLEKKTGLNRQVLRQIVNSQCVVGFKRACNIQDITDGMITVNVLRADFPIIGKVNTKRYK